MLQGYHEGISLIFAYNFDDTIESVGEAKGQSSMTSSYKRKKVKLEPKNEYDTMEEQQNDGNCK
jgi:hypothetical protein